MRPKPLISRCIAFFLLLVFVQKSGAGLFLHNALHKSAYAANEVPAGQDKTKGYGCTCIDDFMMPFDETAEVIIDQPVLAFNDNFKLFADRIVSITPELSSLRGPPALVL